MEVFSNLDLISVGAAIAAIIILGVVVFFNNRKSATNRTFLALACVIVFWSTCNYLSYQFSEPLLSFWILRMVIFFAVLFAFLIFRLFYIFPLETAEIPKTYNRLAIAVTVLTAVLTLTPLVFYQVAQVSSSGSILRINNGFGIYIFGLVVTGLDLIGIVLLIRKTLRSRGVERRQFGTVLFGIASTIGLILVFNFVLPAFFNDPRFIPLSGVFIFPFVAFTAYAIFKQHLMNIKVIATEVAAFLLAIATLFEVIISGSLIELLLRTGVFLLVLAFSVILIQSVIKEVQQKEELQKLYEQLDVKNKQLEDLSRFKSELLSLASHQIRSPLAAIKGFVQLIAGGSYGEVTDKTKEALGKVGKQADELIGLINTLLDVRKVEEGKMEYTFARTDLNKIVTDVVDLLRPLAETKQLQFTFVSPGHEVPVNADAEKLKQVIQNLTDNSIKYTPSGFVKVELTEAAGMATVSVSDSGVGVPATLIPFLFEEFVRDERVKKEIRGTGLGLYIAKKIAEAHGGKVSAESPGEGKGSTFRVSLPMMK